MINLYNANTEFYGTCYKAIIEEGKEKKKKLTAIKKGTPPFQQHIQQLHSRVMFQELVVRKTPEEHLTEMFIMVLTLIILIISSI